MEQNMLYFGKYAIASGKQNVWSAVVRWDLWMSIKSGWLIVLFKSSISLLIFSLIIPPDIDIPHFVSLCIIVLCRYGVFLQVADLRQPYAEHIYQHHFSQHHFLTLFVSLHHIFAILTKLVFFLIFLLFVSWWSIISCLRCYCYNCFGGTMNYALMRVDFIENVVCVLNASLACLSPSSLLLLRPYYSVRHNNIKITPINNPVVVSK